MGRAASLAPWSDFQEDTVSGRSLQTPHTTANDDVQQYMLWLWLWAHMYSRSWLNRLQSSLYKLTKPFMPSWAMVINTKSNSTEWFILTFNVLQVHQRNSPGWPDRSHRLGCGFQGGEAVRSREERRPSTRRVSDWLWRRTRGLWEAGTDKDSSPGSVRSGGLAISALDWWRNCGCGG